MFTDREPVRSRLATASVVLTIVAMLGPFGVMAVLFVSVGWWFLVVAAAAYAPPLLLLPLLALPTLNVLIASSLRWRGPTFRYSLAVKLVAIALVPVSSLVAYHAVAGLFTHTEGWGLLSVLLSLGLVTWAGACTLAAIAIAMPGPPRHTLADEDLTLPPRIPLPPRRVPAI